MTVRWKTEQRLSEHFTVKCSSEVNKGAGGQKSMDTMMILGQNI
jgi:hypothetical protein